MADGNNPTSGYATLKQCHSRAYEYLSKALQIDESGKGKCWMSCHLHGCYRVVVGNAHWLHVEEAVLQCDYSTHVANCWVVVHGQHMYPVVRVPQSSLQMNNTITC